LDEGADFEDQRNNTDVLHLYVPKDLSAEEIDLMRMFYVEGRTYNEIACILSTTERVIKTRMFQLQRQLAEPSKKQ
jgi:DNA-directed RNA polymerase specialized sigma24 family protein